ncbi:hypothetical protein CBL_11806 [Carabus blaptoides fortunei]
MKHKDEDEVQEWLVALYNGPRRFTLLFLAWSHTSFRKTDCVPCNLNSSEAMEVVNRTIRKPAALRGTDERCRAHMYHFLALLPLHDYRVNPMNKPSITSSHLSSVGPLYLAVWTCQANTSAESIVSHLLCREASPS